MPCAASGRRISGLNVTGIGYYWKRHNPQAAEMAVL